MRRGAAIKAALRGSPEFFSPQVAFARRFYLDLNPPKRAALAVVCGGVEKSATNYLVRRSTFPYYSIEYVLRGQGTARLRHRTHQLRSGSVFSYGPGVAHEISGDPADPLVKYFVDFTGQKARRLLHACGLSPGTVDQVFPPTELQGVFEELIRSGSRRTRYSAELCSKWLECLVLKIADCQGPAEGTASLAFNTYQKCRQHIEEHFRELRNLDQVSVECRLNRAYLCRLFQRYDHQSPYQLLLQLKMNLAAELLLEPGVLVKQVAESSGFNDPFHFSRAFKTVIGLAPETFRTLRSGKP
jgi:AraC-like DNA-binding protein/quercetin dioxygenase-like cupin family protein